jgi:cytochrome c556
MARARRFGIRAILLTLLLLGCLGCRKAPEATPVAATPTGGPAAHRPAAGDQTPMSAPGSESGRPGIRPSETVATESGAKPSLSVEQRMKTKVVPAFRALASAAKASQFDAAVTSARDLRSAIEPVPYSPDAPTDRARLDTFIGYSDDEVAAAAKAERAAEAKDAQALAGAVKETEDACGACHKEFRNKD